MRSTMSIQVLGGIPVTVPNEVQDRHGYQVSYNNVDIALYGSDTTAIVVGSTGAFLVLNGDHRQALAHASLEEACAYFHANAELKNEYSDPDENYVLPMPEEL